MYTIQYSALRSGSEYSSNLCKQLRSSVVFNQGPEFRIMTGSTNASLENIALVLDGGGPNLADTRSLEAHHPIQILHNGRPCVGVFATETVDL